MKSKDMSLSVINKIVAELEQLFENPTIVIDIEDELLLDTDVCRIFKISTKTLRRRCLNGEFPYFKLGGTYYYSKYQLYYHVLRKQLQK